MLGNFVVHLERLSLPPTESDCAIGAMATVDSKAILSDRELVPCHVQIVCNLHCITKLEVI